MSELILSDKEQKLLEFIKNSEDDVTIGLIEVLLGNTYVGALGKLISNDLIKSEKRDLEASTNKDLNPYGHKWIKVFKIKEVLK